MPFFSLCFTCHSFSHSAFPSYVPYLPYQEVVHHSYCTHGLSHFAPTSVYKWSLLIFLQWFTSIFPYGYVDLLILRALHPEEVRKWQSHWDLWIQNEQLAGMGAFRVSILLSLGISIFLLCQHIRMFRGAFLVLSTMRLVSSFKKSQVEGCFSNS